MVLNLDNLFWASTPMVIEFYKELKAEHHLQEINPLPSQYYICIIPSVSIGLTDDLLVILTGVLTMGASFITSLFFNISSSFSSAVSSTVLGTSSTTFSTKVSLTSVSV